MANDHIAARDVARHEIAAILQRLEQQTGQLVDSIGLTRFDATTIDSLGVQYLMRVEVALVRIPGHDWLIS